MDLLVLILVALSALLALIGTGVLFTRWRRNRYRFDIRTLLILFALLGGGIFTLQRFIVPICAHRWAIHTVYESGADVVFRDDAFEASEGLYNDPRIDNAWREVRLLQCSTDGQTATVASQLKNLSEAKGLILFGGVTDKGLKAICENGMNSSLGEIVLFETPVTATGLAELAKLNQLQMLTFRSCPIKGADLTGLTSVATLRNLILQERGSSANPNRIDKLGFRAIGQMQNLENLGLDNLSISDEAAGELKNLKQLKMLSLFNCQISYAAINNLRQALPQCKLVVAKDDDAPVFEPALEGR